MIFHICLPSIDNQALYRSELLIVRNDQATLEQILSRHLILAYGLQNYVLAYEDELVAVPVS